MPIKAWSYSRLTVFEQCPRRAELAFVEKIPEPPRPNGSPADRGSAIHEMAERYVQVGGQFPVELRHFEPDFVRLRELYKAKTVTLEQMWCHDKQWQMCAPDAWNDIWLRVKLDACVMPSSDYAVVIDYKTGRKHGNEVKHAEQMQLYQLSAFLRFPELEMVDVEVWYLDENQLTTMRFTRKQGLRFLKTFEERSGRMLNAEMFPATPSSFSCGYCPYKTGYMGKSGVQGTGHCGENP